MLLDYINNNVQNNKVTLPTTSHLESTRNKEAGWIARLAVFGGIDLENYQT